MAKLLLAEHVVWNAGGAVVGAAAVVEVVVVVNDHAGLLPADSLPALLLLPKGSLPALLLPKGSLPALLLPKPTDVVVGGYVSPGASVAVVVVVGIHHGVQILPLFHG